MTKRSQMGFTLIELLTVIAVIGLLSSIIFAAANNSRLRARDSRRLGDMRQLQSALELYLTQNSAYPPPEPGQPCGGWDGTQNGVFIPQLGTSGIVIGAIKDPSPALDAASTCGNYAYYFYSAGAGGCDPGRGGFYVLGVRDMETSGSPHPSSPGWKCPGGTNWQDGFDWVTGSFEK